jgi:transposase InsO family protein
MIIRQIAAQKRKMRLAPSGDGLVVVAVGHRFNHFRPHDALGGKTPAEYLQALVQGDPTPSQMS